MSITTALRTYALADESLSDQLGERFRPVHLEQGDDDAAIAVTYQTISNTPDEGLTEDSDHETNRIQFDVYSDDEALAGTVAKKLRQRLRSAHGSLDVDGEAVVFCTGCSTGSGIRDLSALAPIDGSANWKHRLSFDMMVSFNT